MLYTETVEPGTLGLLKELMAQKELEQFRLAGGTALSLILGHRSSIDLDMFTDNTFDQELVAYTLADKYPSFSSKGIKSPRLLFTYINNIKVDFVNTFEKFAYPYEVKDGIRFASTQEIIALKLNAVAGRGAKKDFWDIHELLNHYSFEDMMSFYYKRYPNNSLMMVCKSITFFGDADLEPDPHCFKNLNWENIKKDIIKKINIYLQTQK
jgi:hypothetical protein